MPSSNQELKRARKQALILGLAMLVTLLSLIYAVSQRERADKLEAEVQHLNQQIQLIEMEQTPSVSAPPQ